MTILYVNTGTSPNKGDGDSLRTSFEKINQNFSELVASIGTGTNGTANIHVGTSSTSTNTGALWFDTISGKMYIYYDSVWVDPNPDAVAGPQGPQGPQGLEGVQGLDGPSGPRGFTGPTGPSGATGSNGSNGLDSIISGPQGPQGPQGAQGSAGPQGPTGFEGPQGPQGPEGPTGPSGATGENSTVSGPSGPVGPSGPDGPSGPTGGEGPTGPSGPDFVGGNIAGDVNITSDTQSTSTDSGALTVVGGVGIGRNLFVGQRIAINQTEELFQPMNGAIGVVTHDCSNGQIFNHVGITNNFTANFTNLNLDNGYATNITLVLNQGGTAYLANAVQIGGVAQTINWQGNSIAPEGSPNKKEVVSFSILNDSGTYLIFGQLVSFG